LKKLLLKNKDQMIKLIYFDFNFWRIDILRLSLGFSNISYDYVRVPREEWINQKDNFPFGQLPVMIVNNNKYAHTHSLAKFCAIQANLYDNDKFKSLIIDQVLDWANEITNKIAPSIRAAMREKNIEKSNKLRKIFIKNDLFQWFGYLEKLFEKSSKNKQFFTDKFSIADITAWRVIYWFWSGTLDQIKPDFLEKFPFLQKFFQKMSKYEDFTKLKEYQDITS
jgi:glutathione S-transferase